MHTIENMGLAHISVNNVISFNKEVHLNTRIHMLPQETHKSCVESVLNIVLRHRVNTAYECKL